MAGVTLACTRRVSIHAPAWGATKPGSVDIRPVMFQSTLPRGERQHGPQQPDHGPGFNPRSRVGSDPYSKILETNGLVSIHAPAWGATNAAHLFLLILPVSIHAPAWGATLQERPCSSHQEGFNPRSRVGSDCLGRSDQPVPGVSIHAPAWGATVAQILSFKTRCSLLLSGNMAFTERNRASVRVVCGCIFN